MIRRILQRCLALAGISLAAAGCPTSSADQPAAFFGPVRPVAVYASDGRNNALAGVSTLVVSSPIPDVLVWAADAARPQTATPPPHFTRFRVEFDQPLDGRTVARQDVDLVPGGSGLPVSTADPLANVTTFSFCTPAGAPDGGATVRLLDLDDAASPGRAIPASVCYDPDQQPTVGPSVYLVPGSGALAPGSASKPLTCEDFSPARADQLLAAAHRYAIAIDPGVKGSHGGALQPPSGGGWKDGVFTFTTDDFRVLGVGYQNYNGLFVWGEKLGGFNWFLPAVPFDRQVDCDATAPDVAQKPCRIWPDGTALEVFFTQPPSASSLDGNVVLARRGAEDEPIGGFGLYRGGRSLAVWVGYRFEPGAEYTLTLKPGIHGTASATTLAEPKVITFKAGSGATASAPKTIQLLSLWPDNGTSAIALATPAVTLVFSHPVDLGGARLSLADPSGAVVSGLAQLADGSDGQEVDVPITGTLAPETAYTFTATGLKVANVAGLPAGVAGAPFDDLGATFTTERFSLTHMVDSLSETYDLDWGNQVPPDLLLTDWAAQFTAAVDPATVTSASLQILEAGAPLDGFEIVPWDDGATFQLVPPASFKPRYDTTYTVIAAGAGSAAPIRSADGKYTVRAEGCAAGDCSKGVSFHTSTFSGAIAVTDRAKGKFKVTFPRPGIDPAQVEEFFATGGEMFALYPRSLSIDPATGQHTLSNDTAGRIAVSCAWNAGAAAHTRVDCAPADGNPLPAGRFFLAAARFYSEKTAGGGPAIPDTSDVDALSGLWAGSLTRTFVTPCP